MSTRKFTLDFPIPAKFAMRFAEIALTSISATISLILGSKNLIGSGS